MQSAHLLIALAVAAIVAAAGTWYFRMMVMRRDELAAGITALADLSWRDFIHRVLEALARRGYARVFDRAAPVGDDDYTLERDGKHVLLSCKHGSAFVLGTADVTELAGAIRMANVSGGILATQGRIADEARPGAALQRIELLDGAALWPELRDLIVPTRLAEIVAGARQKARQRTLLSWLLALVVGVATFLLLSAGTAPAPDSVGAGTPPISAMAAGADSLDDATLAPLATTIAAPDDDAGLDAQRKEVANAISSLPMVDRATWSTASTLQVFLLDTDRDPVPTLCPLLVRYDALSASRVQLTPPPGSDAPTRFRQCRSY